MNEEKESLFEFYVAGVKFHELKTCIDEISAGDILEMISEPENKYDSNAVRLEFPSPEQNKQVMVGYVPAKFSAEVTAYLSIGDLECIVTEVNPGNKTWEQLKVAIEEA